MSEELMRSATLGIDVETFIHTDIGKALVSRARKFGEDALELLKVIHPKQEDDIRTLQNKIWLAEHFEKWLAELIREGWQAEELLKQQRDGIAP